MLKARTDFCMFKDHELYEESLLPFCWYLAKTWNIDDLYNTKANPLPRRLRNRESVFDSDDDFVEGLNAAPVVQGKALIGNWKHVVLQRFDNEHKLRDSSLFSVLKSYYSDDDDDDDDE